MIAHSDCEFDDCEFRDNQSDFTGGGFYSTASTVAVRNSLFQHNSALSDSEYGGGGAFYINDSDATVMNSQFIDNTAPSGGGGGIYAYGATCVYGDTTLTISFNTVTGNSAIFDAAILYSGEGGGLSIGSVGTTDDTACLAAGGGGNSTVIVDNNTISGNQISGADGGAGAGMIVFTDTLGTLGNVPRNPAVAEVRITNNMITNNQAIPGTASYGGGIFAATYGEDFDTITIKDNVVAANTSRGDGGGISAWNSVEFTGVRTIEVHDNAVTGNQAIGEPGAFGGNGGGIDLFLAALDLLAVQSVTTSVEGNTVTGNTSSSNGSDFGLGGGGIVASLLSERSSNTISTIDFHIEDNVITNNSSDAAGGGLSLFLELDTDPFDDGAVQSTTGDIRVEHNLIADNRAIGGGSAVGGGIFAYMEARGDAVATVELELNTLANNQADAGSGGVEFEVCSLFDSFSFEDGLTSLSIDNSVISDNDGFGVGGPQAGQPGLIVNVGQVCFRDHTTVVDYTNLHGNLSGGLQANLNITETNAVSGDPLLAALTYVPGQCSPTIDAGDPSVNVTRACVGGVNDGTVCDFDTECPNGECVGERNPNRGVLNLGHTGNTGAATGSLADVNGDLIVDGVDVVQLSTSHGAMLGDLRYLAATDLDGDDMTGAPELSFIGAQYGTDCN